METQVEVNAPQLGIEKKPRTHKAKSATQPKKPVVAINVEALKKNFDDGLCLRMTRAITKAKWEDVLSRALSAHHNNNLRKHVEEIFLRECPHYDLHVSFCKEVGRPLPADPAFPHLFNDAAQFENGAQIDERTVLEAWEKICERGSMSHAINILQDGVRDRIIKECPYFGMMVKFRAEVGLPMSEEEFRLSFHQKMNAAESYLEWARIANYLVGYGIEPRIAGEHVHHFLQWCPAEFGELERHVREQLGPRFIEKALHGVGNGHRKPNGKGHK